MARPLFDLTTMMGRMLASLDWSETALDPPERWPVALRIAVRAMLASREPRSISWGPSLCLLYNDAYAEMMDGRHPGALARPLPEVWGDVWDLIRPDVESALRGTATFRSAMPLTRLEAGTPVRRWHTVAYSPLFDEAGDIQGVQCLSLNVTDQVLSELVRERELQSLRELFAGTPGFMAVVTGPDYVYELANAAYEDVVGRRGLTGLSAREVLPELEGQGYFQLLDQVRVTGRPFSGHAMPVRFQRPVDAGDRFVDFVFQPIRDAVSGEVERIFIQGTDVTDRERAFQQLHAESTDKDRFLAVLAHELRNPLAPISTAAALLRAGCDATQSQQLGELVQRQALQLSGIVNDLFDVARASRGAFRLDCRALDLTTVLDASIEEVAALVEQKRHRLEVRRPDDAVLVYGDAGRLTQAVTNVLVNAARYTPDGGHLIVELRTREHRAEVVVQDNGVGIEPDALPKLFDLFTQGGDTSSARNGGLGLGLALVKRLVVLHGGEVDAHSDGPGRGATFCIRLPLLTALQDDGLPEASATAS